MPDIQDYAVGRAFLKSAAVGVVTCGLALAKLPLLNWKYENQLGLIPSDTQHAWRGMVLYVGGAALRVFLSELLLDGRDDEGIDPADADTWLEYGYQTAPMLFVEVLDELGTTLLVASCLGGDESLGALAMALPLPRTAVTFAVSSVTGLVTGLTRDFVFVTLLSLAPTTSACAVRRPAMCSDACCGRRV